LGSGSQALNFEFCTDVVNELALFPILKFLQYKGIMRGKECLTANKTFRKGKDINYSQIFFLRTFTKYTPTPARASGSPFEEQAPSVKTRRDRLVPA
jgi:hypothetical protein